MLRKLLLLTIPFLLLAGPAWACGGLIAPNGAVALLRTSTMAAYVGGEEHYVTAFQFAGAAGEFGSIVPLPGVPRKVQKAGDWTLQRLLREVAPPVPSPLLAADGVRAVAGVAILQQVEIDALDITILRGGGRDVAAWAQEQGFDLSPDAPEVLQFYSRRSPVFMAAEFDAARAREQGLDVGDGTPIHLTIPTDDPWVPLRILSLAKQPDEIVQADVFLLTEREPSILPLDGTRGLTVVRSETAAEDLLTDLRSDRGMGWLPASDMWLTYLQLAEPAGELVYDLAIDVSGGNAPSLIDHGVPASEVVIPHESAPWIWALVVGLFLALLTASALERRLSAGRG